MWIKLIKVTVLLIFLFPGFNYGQKLNPGLKPLEFLVGSWEMDTPEGIIIETWTYAGNSALKGNSFRINTNGDTLLLEKVRLSAEGKYVYYIPTVFNQNDGQPVKFRLLSSKNRMFIFENQGHDFPQRIVYRLKSAAELQAWIEGKKDGKFIKKEFSYRRLEK